MKRFVLALSVLLGCAPARAEAPQPFVLIRALQELQTQIVAGKARAREDQPRMLADIGKQFVAAPAERWSDPRNARAAVIWLLGGGSPRTMRALVAKGTFPKPEFELARGAVAFSEGRGPQAREILLPVDARKLEPSLGAQVALVQAALALPDDIGKSIEFLGVARLLAPGTLMEETALRREISLVGQTSDVVRFSNLSRQYARRFKSSLYAEEFRESFTQTFMRIGIRASADQVPTLEPILDAFDADEKCRLAILIARASLLEGAWRAASAFAEAVMRPPVERSCDVPRARLYLAAARAMQPENEGDLIALEKLDASRLSMEDRVLRRASLAYAQAVRSWPDPRPPEDPSEVNKSADDMLAQAEQALSESSGLLKGRRR